MHLFHLLDEYFGITVWNPEPFPNAQDEKLGRNLGWPIFVLVALEVVLVAVLLGGFIIEAL